MPAAHGRLDEIDGRRLTGKGGEDIASTDADVTMEREPRDAPEQEAVNLSGVRLILCPAFAASPCCRCNSVNSAPSSIPGFCNGWRSRGDTCADIVWQVEAL
jgi:hypothetical protein